MYDLINELEKELNQLSSAWNQFGKVDRMKSIVKKMKQNYTHGFTPSQLWRLAQKHNADDFEMHLKDKDFNSLLSKYCRCDAPEYVLKDHVYKCNFCNKPNRF